MKKLALYLSLASLVLGIVLSLSGVLSSNTHSSKAESQEVTSTTTSQSKESESKTSQKASPVETETVETQTAVAEATNEPTSQEPVVAQVTHVAQPVVTTSAHVLTNGNTAGEVGTYAAAQMAAATGVDQATWEHIIARESNGQVGARNASGASGLFQTMPGWGSTATVQDQINSALNAYNAQGLAAWGY
ncbi:transglycosylase [Streptococcus pluranimalium]|uniref:transglycosylase n=1 Tax=Streptococcus pluranimalium TaxID=82348 RepID=UPI0039FDE01F